MPQQTRARRTGIDEVVAEYNVAIEAACAETPNCTSDDGALHDLQFERADVSEVDDFHPSRRGQAALAAAAWPAVESALVR